ncbi:MAG: hypothetical protein JWN23_899 [Rhodocyclales bacterium]|nr:hypothetical protein [Rhodocyclales bacterium]
MREYKSHRRDAENAEGRRGKHERPENFLCGSGIRYVTVIPAKAGIHLPLDAALSDEVDSRFRGNDGRKVRRHIQPSSAALCVLSASAVKAFELPRQQE